MALSRVAMGTGLKRDGQRKAAGAKQVSAATDAAAEVLLTPDALGDIVAELRSARAQWRNAQHRRREAGGREFPSQEVIERVAEQLRAALFPMRLGPVTLRQEAEDYYVGDTLDRALVDLVRQVELEFAYRGEGLANGFQSARARAVHVVQQFAATLPQIRRQLDRDVQAAYDGDPAARSVDEVLLCYPGVQAMILHRLAHRLYQLDATLVARIIAELAHSRTGIDIHPGASIGEGFFMDHGTGIVIGETAIIGERVRLYQAVTLGAKRFPTDEDGRLEKRLLRHPIVEDDVVIYAGATVLGRVTIGRGSTIGGNVWVTHDVPPGSHVTQANLQHDVITLPPDRQAAAANRSPRRRTG